MQFKDPVCGMMVDDKTAEARSTHQGKTYYFCSEECKNTFDTDPDRYTADERAGATS